MSLREYWAAHPLETKAAWDVFENAILDTDEQLGKVAPPWEWKAYGSALGLPDHERATHTEQDMVEICGPVGCGKDQIIALAALAFVKFGPRGAKAVKQSTSKDKSKEVVDTAHRFIARSKTELGWGVEIIRDEIRAVCPACSGDRCLGGEKCKGNKAHQPSPGSRLTRVACASLDGSSAVGVRATLFLINECQDWNYKGKNVYDHMFARHDKVGGRFVCFTNAPFTPRGEWRRDRWEEARREGSDWFYLQVKVEDCKWLMKTLEKKKRNISTQQFRRWYLCEPTDGRGELVTKEELKRCVFPSLVRAPGPSRAGKRFMGVDLAYARDHAVIVVLCATPEGAAVLERVDVWVPPKDGQIQLEDVEKRARMYLTDWKCKGLFDPYQAIEMVQRLEADGLDVQTVASTAVNMTLMCSSVRELVRDGRLRLFPDAGRTMVSDDVSTDLVQQIVDAEVKESERGEKIVSKRSSSVGHGDQLSAFALAALGVTQEPKTTTAYGFAPSDDTETASGSAPSMGRKLKQLTNRVLRGRRLQGVR